MQADPHKKNMERMEERVPNANEQQLQHMLSDSPWDHQAVMDQVALEADGLLGGNRNSCLLIDESGFKKSGRHSVGVARQWCGRLGKVENCQVGVFAALGRDRRVTLVDERLYLLEKWSDDPTRCEEAGLSEAAIRRVQERVRRRVLKAFVRWGLLEPEVRDEMLEWAKPDRRSCGPSQRVERPDRKSGLGVE